jgi:hypothetical protein
MSPSTAPSSLQEAVRESWYPRGAAQAGALREAERATEEEGHRGAEACPPTIFLVPSRPRHEHGDPAHAGTIITTRPDEMRGTDATRFYTEREGWCWFFGAVDHYTTEVMGWHVAKIGDRWAALEPIRQGMTTAFCGGADAVRGRSGSLETRVISVRPSGG